VKVLLAGDTHGNLPHVSYVLHQALLADAPTVLQVGDFGYWPHMEPFHEKVDRLATKVGITWMWLDGNHENFDALELAVDVDADVPQQMGESLFYLPRAATWDQAGARFMSLGGAHSIDKAYRLEGVSWWPQELITRTQVDRALDRGHVDVLLTHDAPEGLCPIVSDDYKGDDVSRGNRKAVSAVMEASRPQLLVHGHFHHRYSARADRTQVEGLDRDDQGADSWLVIDTDDWRMP
jgi:predicted phosphodiesterase